MFRLKELRRYKNITQKELSAILGVSPALIGFYENEINHPAPDMLIKIADYFDCSIDYLVGREDDFGNITSTGESSGLTADEEKLVSIFRTMSPTRQATVLDTVEGLADLDKRNRRLG